MFRKERCYNGGNKHNFQPRYSEKPSDQHSDISAKNSITSIDFITAVRKLMYYDVYIHDICVWCGITINNIKIKK